MTGNTGSGTALLVRRVVALAAVIAVAGALGACREEEQNRQISFEKGVYQGPADEPLTEDQVRELQHRGESQNY